MSGILSNTINRNYSRSTANDIFKQLRTIRSKSGLDNILRRLLWELIQNAKDSAVLSSRSCDVEVDVKVELTQNSFTFSHNNGFFTDDNIVALIQKSSSIDKEAPRHPENDFSECITGRFGTGFMTTHVLSEFVRVKGLLEYPKDKFRDFELVLDRTGKSQSDLESSISKTIEHLESEVGKESFSSFKGKNTWTAFQYELSDDGYDHANRAIDGLMESLGYVLINLPLINSITIERGGEVKSFRLEESNQDHGGDLMIKRVRSNDSQFNDKGYIQKLGDNLSVTIPVHFDGDQGIGPIRIDADQPRLFLDFPLVGTEVLQIPFVVNAHGFEPSTEREGIFLADSEDDNTLQNKKLIKQATDLYLDLVRDLSSMSETRSLYNLVSFGDVEEEDWLSSEWFMSEIVNYSLGKLLTIPLVDSNGAERKAINDKDGNGQIYFPFHSKEIIVDRIWKLSNDLFPKSLPNEEDAKEWAKIIWKGCYKQSLKSLTEDIQNLKSLEKLGESLEKNEEETIAWLNDYFDLLCLEGVFISCIQANEFWVIPSRSGKLKSPSGLRICEKLDDEIIEVCEMLDYNINNSLLHKNVWTNDKYRDDNAKSILYLPLDRKSVAAKLNESFKGHSNSRNAVNYLLSLFAEDDNFPKENQFIYQASKDLLEDDIPEKTNIKNWIPEFWDYSCKARLNRLISVISEFGSLNDFSKYAESRNIEEPKEWLINFSESLLSLGYRNKFNLKESPIVPTQNGGFKNLEALFAEAEKIDDALLDIAAAFGEDFRENLIDRDFNFLDIPESRQYPKEKVVDAIIKAVTTLFELSERSKETEEIFAQILDWFDENPVSGKKYFRGLYENRHSLLSAAQFKKLRKDSARLKEMEKQEQRMTSILEKHQIKDMDELERRLSQVKLSSSVGEKKETKDRTDLLASGIWQESQGESLNQHSKILRFAKGNYSSDDYAYVKAILKRAVKNVLNHLRKDDRYEFQSDIESIMVSTETITVISGVKKNGQPINLVIRPSDGQKVHVFYGAEFNALKHENTEFWIDNGSQEPEILTIGKILEYTGTEVIPLYRIAES